MVSSEATLASLGKGKAPPISKCPRFRCFHSFLTVGSNPTLPASEWMGLIVKDQSVLLYNGESSREESKWQCQIEKRTFRLCPCWPNSNF